ncbi:MAG: hypothetical protein EAZ89_14220 [Bacteroidetes bacterium]|nr:MAG: hypothetical protein EAZ89_14220 [Bacteroidota bacterium]
MSDTPRENPFSLLHIFEVARTYRVYILGVILLSVIAAFVLTMPFIYKPEYLASTTIYPTGAERFDLTNLFAEEPDIYLYGSAKEVEKLDNIASSESVKMYVIDSLDLWSAYGVSKTETSPRFKVLKIYAGNVRNIRTEGNGLTIEAYDTDPQRAADIVNLVANRVDAVNKEMLNQNKVSILDLYRRSAANLQVQMTQYNDSARSLRRRYNVLRSLTQSEVMAEQVLLAEGELGAAQARYREAVKVHGASSGIAISAKSDIEAARGKVSALVSNSSGSSMNLEKFREGLDQVMALEEQTEYLSMDLENVQEKIRYLEMMDLTPFSTVLKPETAYPSDRKARPVRWVIVIAALLISALVSIAGALIIDRMTVSLNKND